MFLSIDLRTIVLRFLVLSMLVCEFLIFWDFLCVFVFFFVSCSEISWIVFVSFVESCFLIILYVCVLVLLCFSVQSMFESADTHSF